MINTIESMHEHLQWALELEHATIPPYLCALYSIKEGSNQESVEVIKSVFIEEMLHMALVANILVATGGKPRLDYPGFMKKYPTPLPHSDKSFEVNLNKFSPESIDCFLKIERPTDADAPSQDDEFSSIGQFYKAIEEGLIHLSNKIGEGDLFVGNPEHQVTAETTYYGGAGHLIAVTDLATSLQALGEVVEQGEGLDHGSIFDGDQNMFHPERQEVGHYFRFLEILKGRKFKLGDTAKTGPTGEKFSVEWDKVHPMEENPLTENFTEYPEIIEKLTTFNYEYSDMLRTLEKSFNGAPKLLGQAVGVMFELKILAKELMMMPMPNGSKTVGPSFEYLPPKSVDIEFIEIRENGPYVVHGSVPLVRKKRITGDNGESIAWQKLESQSVDAIFELCRCGKSANKPYCDGTHDRFLFDGSETATIQSINERQEILQGDGVRVKVDNSYCMHAKFCFNQKSGIRKLITKKSDDNAKINLSAMVERCPSGTFTYELEVDGVYQEVEADLPKQIAIISADNLESTAGPLWVSGKIPVRRSDGQPLETRNRMTLCRCGASSNKPFCDGSHVKINFKEEV
jgi:CDGSH-type Zn-finger protein